MQAELQDGELIIHIPLEELSDDITFYLTKGSTPFVLQEVPAQIQFVKHADETWTREGHDKTFVKVSTQPGIDVPREEVQLLVHKGNTPARFKEVAVAHPELVQHIII